MRLPGMDPDGGAGQACEQEPAVLAAYRPGAEPSAAEAARAEEHLAGCESCRRAAQVSAALSVLAAEGSGVALPDPHHLLWRARVLDRFAARDEAAERAAQPVVWAAVAGVVAG